MRIKKKKKVFNLCHEVVPSGKSEGLTGGSEFINGDGVYMGYFRDISTFAACTAGPVAALANIQVCVCYGVMWCVVSPRSPTSWYALVPSPTPPSLSRSRSR
jgi:hypothetical protein